MSQWPELRALGNTDFNVEIDDFSKLEIRPAGADRKFHYFYHAGQGRLITDFVIENKPQVATMCTVTLIRKNDDGYSPRLRFWKKDKTQAGKQAMDIHIPDNEATREIKASVNTGDAYRNFWKLIDFLQSFKDVALPGNDFRVVSATSAQLAEQFRGSDRRTVLEAVGTFLEGSLTQADIHLIANRKGKLDYFSRLLRDEAFFEAERRRLNKGKEGIWQHFFENNAWIFGYGLTLISCESFDGKKLERYTTGASLFTGAGKRSDAVMRSRGAISSLLFCEIKTPGTPLLEKDPYRPPDVYQVSMALTGAVSQVQKTADKALRGIRNYVERHYDSNGSPTAIEFSTVRPRCVVVIGNLDQLSVSGAVNPEQLSSFEFYRKAIGDAEIITFDELYQRARFIVEDA